MKNASVDFTSPLLLIDDLPRWKAREARRSAAIMEAVKRTTSACAQRDLLDQRSHTTPWGKRCFRVIRAEFFRIIARLPQ